MLQAAILVVFPLLAAYAAATDFLTMTIPNRVSILLVACFCLVAPAIGLPLATIGWHVAAAGVVFAIGFFFFAMGWMGGGDVKFGAAVALWLGWGHLLDYAVLFSLIGGLLTLATLVASRYLEWIPILQVGYLADFSQKKTVPYGIALAAAALALYPATPFMRSLI